MPSSWALPFLTAQANVTREADSLLAAYFIYDIDTLFSGYVVVKPDFFKVAYARMLALQ